MFAPQTEGFTSMDVAGPKIQRHPSKVLRNLWLLCGLSKTSVPGTGMTTMLQFRYFPLLSDSAHQHVYANALKGQERTMHSKGIKQPRASHLSNTGCKVLSLGSKDKSDVKASPTPNLLCLFCSSPPPN